MVRAALLSLLLPSFALASDSHAPAPLEAQVRAATAVVWAKVKSRDGDKGTLTVLETWKGSPGAELQVTGLPSSDDPGVSRVFDLAAPGPGTPGPMRVLSSFDPEGDSSQVDEKQLEKDVRDYGGAVRFFASLQEQDADSGAAGKLWVQGLSSDDVRLRTCLLQRARLYEGPDVKAEKALVTLVSAQRKRCAVPLLEAVLKIAEKPGAAGRALAFSAARALVPVAGDEGLEKKTLNAAWKATAGDAGTEVGQALRLLAALSPDGAKVRDTAMEWLEYHKDPVAAADSLVELAKRDNVKLEPAAPALVALLDDRAVQGEVVRVLTAIYGNPGLSASQWKQWWRNR